MNNFKFYRKIKLTDQKVQKAFSKLSNLYNKIPETEGCLENINKENGCESSCCLLQTPQLLYIEFLYLWNAIRKNISNKIICELIEKSMKNSVIGETTKGCIFFNKTNKKCDVHKWRCYNCRLYGITPEEEFKPRYEKMKKIYKNVVGAVIKEQCSLITTINKKKVTVKDTDRWWSELVDIEHSIGIPENKINDDVKGGSYRTPHDHLLLYLMPENILGGLSGIRLYDNKEDKRREVEKLINIIKTFYKIKNG